MPELVQHGLDPLDVASGFAFGFVRDAPALPPPAPTVLDAISGVLARLLARPPCLVAFSGGHDSSAVLGLACRVASEHGLDAPIPVTYRFPGHETTEEGTYQEAVIAQLGVGDWVRIEIDDELECIGPHAADAVARVGLRWPFNLFFFLPLAVRAAGGSLVCGAGGDELLAPGTHERAVGVLTGQRRPRRADLRPVLGAVAPRALRARHFGRVAMPPVWLTATGTAAFRDAAAELRGRAPWRYDRETVEVTWPSRYIQHVHEGLTALGTSTGTHVSGLFVEPEVVATLAARCGRRGPASRSALLDELCPWARPAELRTRRTKASFDSVFWGRRARAFSAAAVPEDLPVDRALVDPVRLVAEWRRPDPDARSYLLAQRCALGAAARP